MKVWENIRQGQKARLQSPIISSAKCVKFYYFMGGTTVGELAVYVKPASGEEKVVWQLIGDQGYKWNKGMFSIDGKYKNFNVSSKPSYLLITTVEYCSVHVCASPNIV